jgi:Zn finger protein HypA/HybF involved in hydrogenase expression
MHNVDSELQRLQKAEQEACNRVMRFLHRVTDPAAMQAAKSICTEAMAALRAYLAKRKSIRD